MYNNTRFAVMLILSFDDLCVVLILHHLYIDH